MNSSPPKPPSRPPPKHPTPPSRPPPKAPVSITGEHSNLNVLQHPLLNTTPAPPSRPPPKAPTTITSEHIPAQYMINTCGHFLLTGSDNLDVVFGNKHRTMFIDGTVTSGITRLTVSVEKFSDSCFAIGAAQTEEAASGRLFDDLLGHAGCGNRAGIGYWLWREEGRINEEKCFGFRSDERYRGIDGALLCVEADMDTRMLRFSVNGVTTPWRIQHVPISVRLGVSGCGHTMHFVCLEKVGMPLQSPHEGWIDLDWK